MEGWGESWYTAFKYSPDASKPDDVREPAHGSRIASEGRKPVHGNLRRTQSFSQDTKALVEQGLPVHGEGSKGSKKHLAGSFKPVLKYHWRKTGSKEEAW